MLIRVILNLLGVFKSVYFLIVNKLWPFKEKLHLSHILKFCEQPMETSIYRIDMID